MHPRGKNRTPSGMWGPLKEAIRISRKGDKLVGCGGHQGERRSL